MNNTKLIELSIKKSLLSKWSITRNDILEKKINGYLELDKITHNLLNDFKSGKIKHISCNQISDEDVDYILGLFPISLHELDPIDFEGDDPLSIDELFETASYYIFSDIKSHKLKNVEFYI